MPDTHAKLFSPSAAEGWFACPGRPIMEAEFPDQSNAASDVGTARHTVVANCLTPGYVAPSDTPADWVGERIVVRDGEHVHYSADWVDEDTDYVETVRRMAEFGVLLVEQQVDFSRWTGVLGDSFGTLDAGIIAPLTDGTHELIVIDRKTGYHEVPVERNKQLMLYALGMLARYDLEYDITRVRLVIHQRAAREWVCTVQELLAFGEEVSSAAQMVRWAVRDHGRTADWHAVHLNPKPTEDACRYCRAMAVCPSMQSAIQDAMQSDFDPLDAPPPALATGDALALAMRSAGMVEDWIKAVRAEVERRLLAGQGVEGFKLVLGKAGNRAWKDGAEAALKSMRLKVEEMYDLSLISPTTAEKLTKAKDGEKPVIGPRQWAKLQALIGRSEPRPSVAPTTDKRDAWSPPDPAQDFQPLIDLE